MTTVVPQAGLESTLTLLARARLGDRMALESIAERYQVALKRFARGRLPASTRGLVETDDIVQMALMSALRRIDDFEPQFRGSLLAYLRAAVLNHIRDEIRRAQRRPVTAQLSADMSTQLPGSDPDPLQAVISREALEQYDAALAELPADQQEAFMMRIEMNCSYREIADAMGRPSSESARMLVRRAIDSLASTLRRTRTS
jgi:RNA polymerase sigma-70 factor (ECF subfamily)